MSATERSLGTAVLVSSAGCAAWALLGGMLAARPRERNSWTGRYDDRRKDSRRSVGSPSIDGRGSGGRALMEEEEVR